MTGERAAIFGQFIERYMESEVQSSDREETYRILIEILSEFDIRGMEGYLNIDPVFDYVWNETYPPDIMDETD